MHSVRSPLAGLGRLLFLFGCTACGDKLPLSPNAVSSIAIVPPAVDLNLGAKFRLTVIERNAAGEFVGFPPPGTVTFASRDTTRVAVDSAGTVTAIAVGPTYVVATFLGAAHRLVDSVAVDVATTL
jgi:hypothetical protein